jgi:drug/metabolite transporter (DMT)-like permease
LDRDVEVALGQTAVTAVLWGTSFPVISVGIQQGLAPLTFVFLRFALAAPLMVAYASTSGKAVASLLRTRAVWVLGVLNAAGFLCQFVGQQYTPPSVAALLVNLSVILAALGGALFLGERLGRLKVAGVVLAVGGTALITTNGDLGTLTGSAAVGDSLYLVGAVTWAAYIVYAKKKTDELHWEPTSLAACVVAITAVVTAPAAAFGGVGALPSSSLLLVVAYTAVFNTAVPFVLYQRGLRYLTAGSSALVLMLEIVVAMVVSASILGEALTGIALLGAAMVLVSILFASGLELRGKSLSVPSEAGSGVKAS